MTDELQLLAKNMLETIAEEDKRFFQRHGFYTTKTKAGECRVLVFEIPKQKKEYEQFRRIQKC